MGHDHQLGVHEEITLQYHTILFDASVQWQYDLLAPGLDLSSSSCTGHAPKCLMATVSFGSLPSVTLDERT